MKNLLYILLLLPLTAIGQSPDQNYVKTHTYQEETAASNAAKALVNVTYLDGLGRPIQQVAAKSSPSGKDIVTHIEYDSQGRQPKEFLPYASAANTFLYDPLALDKTNAFYNTAAYEFTGGASGNPYSETFYDNSPLKRTTKQAAPGLPWKGTVDTDYNTDNDNDRTIKMNYRLNKANEVRYFGVNFMQYYQDMTPNYAETALVPKNYYKAGQLYKTITKDENWVIADGLNKTTEEFKDKHGRIILKRNYNNNAKHDTYYVYDDYSNLTYVIPPLASDQIVETEQLNNFVGFPFPWTRLSRVDRQLAEDYEKILINYDDSEILNLDLINQYGGQGGFSVIPDGNGSIILNLNITTTQPMPLQVGTIADLTSVGTFADKELGKIIGQGFEYYFTLSGNMVKVDGYGSVPSIYLNTTLAGETPLEYSKNYPWTKVCRADEMIAAQYEKDILGLDNSAILNTYTVNPYGAMGGVSISLDKDDNFNISLNIATTTPLELLSGELFPLEFGRSLPDTVLGSVNGSGYQYEFSIKNNSLHIVGYGPITNLTFWNSRAFRLRETIKTQVVDGLCYIYHYDKRERVTEKKIPGMGWEHLVYDKMDRVVLTQDQNLRNNTTWLFTKYDKYNRPAYTGKYVDARGRVALQALYDAAILYSEEREGIASGPVYFNNGMAIRYSNLVDPRMDNTPEKTDTYLHAITYYDDFDRDASNNKIVPASDLIQPVTVSNLAGTPDTLHSQNKSLVVGIKIRVLDTQDWIVTGKGYDTRGRELWNHVKNPYLGSENITTSQLDFTGKPAWTQRRHLKAGFPELAVYNTFTYDKAGRLVRQLEAEKPLTGNDVTDIAFAQIIFNNIYDELGQLDKKDVGGLQKVDYSYNVRGWLKGLNDITENLTTSNSLYSFKINYNTPDLGAQALFNGNISETHWKAKSDNKQRSYKYDYDGLNRLKTANYHQYTYLTTSVAGQLENYTEGPVNYDKNGNIVNLQRYGLQGTSTINKIDNLTYVTEPFSNRLLKVTDAASTPEGFDNAGSGTTNDYSYDSNGNMQMDRNKGIGTVPANWIKYNFRNLPTEFVVANGTTNGSVKYVYDAIGAKLEKRVTQSGTLTVTQYDSGYIYEKAGSAANKLQFFSNAEGYAKVPAVTTNPATSLPWYNPGTFEYIYQYKDHLGNTRLSYTKGTALTAIASESGLGVGRPAYTGGFTEYNGASVGGSLSNGLLVSTTAANSGITRFVSSNIAAGSKIKVTITGDKYTTNKVRILAVEKDANGNSNQQVLGYLGAYTSQILNFTAIGQYPDLYISLEKDPTSTDVGTATSFYVSLFVVNGYGNTIVEEDHYYAFGLKHKGYTPVTGLGNPLAQKYDYNGKEFQEELKLGWYDYQARNYDPALGRWFNVDPLAEKSRRFSPYVYTLNNPVYFIDPDGMEAEINKANAEAEMGGSMELEVDAGYGRKITSNNRTMAMSVSIDLSDGENAGRVERLQKYEAKQNLKKDMDADKSRQVNGIPFSEQKAEQSVRGVNNVIDSSKELTRLNNAAKCPEISVSSENRVEKALTRSDGKKVTFYDKAFSGTNLDLAYTIGHEFNHAVDFSTGQLQKWSKEYGVYKMEVLSALTEIKAYRWEASWGNSEAKLMGHNGYLELVKQWIPNFK